MVKDSEYHIDYKRNYKPSNISNNYAATVAEFKDCIGLHSFENKEKNKQTVNQFNGHHALKIFF